MPSIISFCQSNSHAMCTVQAPLHFPVFDDVMSKHIPITSQLHCQEFTRAITAFSCSQAGSKLYFRKSRKLCFAINRDEGRTTYLSTLSGSTPITWAIIYHSSVPQTLLDDSPSVFA